MYKVETTTPPNFAAVHTSDMDAFLRLNTTAEDTLVASLVDAATDLFTSETGYVPCAQTMRLRLDGWPSVWRDYHDVQQSYPWPFNYSPNYPGAVGTIYLPRYPVNSITLVEYLDQSAVWQTLAGWTSDTVSTPARIQLPTSLPALHPTQKPAVRVTFTAGFADGSVPSGVQLAIKLLASHWYNNATGGKGAFTQNDYKELPKGWLSLTSRYNLGLIGDWNR